MVSSNEFSSLKEIFSIVFNLDESIDWEATSAEEIEGWDSISHVHLIAALESEFDVFVETDDALQITSFCAAVNYLSSALS